MDDDCIRVSSIRNDTSKLTEVYVMEEKHGS